MAAAVWVVNGEWGEQALPHGALAVRQVPLTVGDVIEHRQSGQPAGNAGVEPGGPAGAGPQRHHEAHVRGVGGAQVLQVAQARVGDHDQAGGQRGGQGLDGGHERGQLVS
jgi:hypothetical protein